MSEAIFTQPNNTIKFADVPRTGVTVERGMTHDGIGRYVSHLVKKSPHSTADISGILKERNVDVVINYLPVGSEMATKWYAEQILDARCAMVTASPYSSPVKSIGGTASWNEASPLSGTTSSPRLGQQFSTGF